MLDRVKCAWLVGLLGLGCVGHLVADVGGSSCSQFEIYALYLTPGNSPFLAGDLIESVTGPPQRSSIQPISVNVDYNWGVRALGRRHLGCQAYAAASYIYYSGSGGEQVVLDSPDQQLRSGSFLISLTDGFARWHEWVEFQSADGLLGYDWICSGCFRSSLFAGGTYALIEDNLNLQGEDPELPNATAIFGTTKSRFSGGGALIGIDGCMRPWKCLELSAALYTGVCVGTRSAVDFDESFTVFTPGLTLLTQFEVRDPKRIVSALWGLDLAVGFSRVIRCAQVTARIGYMMRHYSNALALTLNPGQTATTSTFLGSTGADFRLAGPYVGLSVGF